MNDSFTVFKKHRIVWRAIARLCFGFVVTALFSTISCAQGDATDLKTYKLYIDNEHLRVAISLPNGDPLINIDRLFSLRFDDNTWVEPDKMDARPNPDDPFSCIFTNERAEVRIQIVPEHDRVVFDCEVLCKKDVITRAVLFGEYKLSGRPRTRFLWPRTLGNELFESFLSSKQRMIIDYPHAFCDFCEANVANTPVYFYRSSYEKKPCSSILTIIGGDPPIFHRAYRTYIRPGERWKPPAAACQVGGDLRETLLRYKRECRLGKPLKEKMTPHFFERWAATVRARVPAPVNGGYRVLEAFPMPASIFIQNWMYGGFDRKYPDFMPPNNSYGGEKGFRAFVQAAKKEGHLVQPYVNFTWWSEGWENARGEVSQFSEPAPSLEQHGDIALSRDLNGELIKEEYRGPFGYLSCPAHPVVVERSREVRDALLDEYGVDFLYQDQLGARMWPLDLNPALKNPTHFGDALMAIGRETAKLCPVSTEWGHDRVLDFATVLNYWCLPPLSPINVVTSRSRVKWQEGQGRCFPYALYLSSGDAVPAINACQDPARLAWAMLLGGRISLGKVYDSLSDGVDHETTVFLQRLAKAIGERTIGSRLLKFEYLADRVARSQFDNHVVLANFSDKPWPVDDAVVAPDGFDLRVKDGFRAGRYLGTSKESVLAIVNPDKKTVTTLAPGGFEARVGELILKAKVPSVKRTKIRRKAALLDFGANIGMSGRGDVKVDDLVKAFSALSLERVESLDELEKAIGRNRVLINAQSESYPVRELGDWPTAINRIREWCEAGGIWVEPGRWPMWTIVHPKPADEGNRWERTVIGKSGFENLLGERGRMSVKRDIRPSARPLHVTDLGRSVLSAETISALEGQSAIVTTPAKDFEPVCSLCENEDGNYIMIHTVGHGAIVRLGGAPVGSAPAALSETVVAMLDGKLELDRPVWRAPICREVKPVSAKQHKESVMSNPDGNTIRIEAHRGYRRYDRMIFGQFLEHFHRQVYGGVFEPGSPLADNQGFRKDVVAALRELQVPIVRWPGGCFVSAYHWKHGVGPERQPSYDKAWRVEDPNTFGTDEFVAWCRLIGAEPYICTNAGTGSPEEMSDWVEYCNLESMGRWARLRQSNGYTEPHNVKFWSVGNENYGDWEMGSKTADEWGHFVAESAKMMKRVDPDIILLAAALPYDVDWTLGLLRAAGQYLDYVSIHGYWDRLQEENKPSDYLTCVGKSLIPEAAIRRTEQVIAVAGYEGRIGIAFDEWNLRSWHHPSKGDVRERDKNDINSTYTMADAVFSASFLNSCLRHCDVVRMANMAPVINTRGPLFVYPQGIVKRTTFHVMAMYANHLEPNVVDTWTEVSSLQCPKRSVPVLDVIATCDDDKKRWSVAVVNRSPEQEVTCELTLGDRKLSGKYPAIVLSGETCDSYNDIGNPDRVVPENVEMPFEEGLGTFPPHSVTIVKIADRK